MAFLPVTQLEISSVTPIDPAREYRVENGVRASAIRNVKTLRKWQLKYKGQGTSNKILLERFITQTLRSIAAFEFTHPYGYTITNATNATPIVITTQYTHDYLENDYVIISGVDGNTNANGTYQISTVQATSFALRDIAGNGTFSDPNANAKVQLYLPRVKIVSEGTFNFVEKELGPNKNDYGIFFITFEIEELL